jgi:hypothetical protein
MVPAELRPETPGLVDRIQDDRYRRSNLTGRLVVATHKRNEYLLLWRYIDRPLVGRPRGKAMTPPVFLAMENPNFVNEPHSDKCSREACRYTNRFHWG